MICPSCGSKNTRVIDSRVSPDSSIRRRRECETCGFRFTTYEKIASPSLVVVKKNGSKEQFDREKLFDGIKKAFSKRPVDNQIIDALVSKIETELAANEQGEIDSVKIGEITLKYIKDIDPVAFVRYASVFGGVESLGDFENLLDTAKAVDNINSESLKTPTFLRESTVSKTSNPSNKIEETPVYKNDEPKVKKQPTKKQSLF